MIIPFIILFRIGWGGAEIPSFLCMVDGTLWFRVEIEVPLFLSQTWPDTFEVHI